MLVSHFQSTNSDEYYSSTFKNSFPLISYTLQCKFNYRRYKKMDFNDSFSIEELQAALEYSNALAVGVDNLSREMLTQKPKIV